MLSLQDYTLINEEIEHLFEGELMQFSDDQIVQAEYYDIKWNPVSGKTEVNLYNSEAAPLGTMAFDDADIAIEFIEDNFDIDDDDVEELENYSWADNYDDRIYDTVYNPADGA
jgi:hypothetical protein